MVMSSFILANIRFTCILISKDGQSVMEMDTSTETDEMNTTNGSQNDSNLTRHFIADLVQLRHSRDIITKESNENIRHDLSSNIVTFGPSCSHRHKALRHSHLMSPLLDLSPLCHVKDFFQFLNAEQII